MVEQMEIQKNKETINSLISENIQEQFEQLNKKIQGNKKETIKVAEAFTTHGNEVLKTIRDGFRANEKKSNKETEDTYRQANEAFKTDINDLKGKLAPKKEKKTTNDIVDDVYYKPTNPTQKTVTETETPTTTAVTPTTLDDLLTIVGEIDELLEENKTPEEQTAEAEENKETALNILTTPRTEATAKKFFETGPKSDFEAVMKYFIEKNLNLKNLLTEKIEDPELKNQVDNFINGIKKYEPNTNINTIKIGTSSESFGDKFKSGELLIQVDETQNNKKYLTRGSNEYVQELIAQGGELEKLTTQDVTRKDQKYGIDKFTDDNGNFRGFKKFLEGQNKKNPDYFKTYMAQIMDQIKNYNYIKETTYKEDNYGTYIKDKTKKEYTKATEEEIKNEKIQKYTKIDTPKSESLTENEMRNGYATALTEFIVDNPENIINYNKYITEDNLIFLGVDKATRIANYNKLVPVWKKNREAIDSETQQRLIKLGATIGAQDKMSPQEAIKKGFDNLLEQFGPMLISIMQLFGYGKKSLLKMFPNYADKINELYRKEYSLDEAKITAINKIQGNFFSEIKPNRIETAKEIKRAFTQLDTYKKEIKNYGNLIDISVFKNGLEDYNKENKTSIKLEQIITIKTNSTTKEKSIEKILDTDTFNKILDSIIDDDKIRGRIAASNEKIQKKVVEEKITKNYTEQGLEGDDKINSYKIKSQEDIARYLTVALFSNKDMVYVMVESGLNDRKPIPNKPDENNDNKPAEKLTFIDNIYDPNTGVTAEGAKKMIHEIIDMKNAPKNLIVVHNGIEIPVTQTTDYVEGGKKITTYIKEDKTRVKIFKNDIIKQPEATTQTPQEKYKENTEKITTSLQNITTNEPNKYKSFEFGSFSYNKDVTGDQKEYQENLLTPTQTILTNEEQFKLSKKEDIEKIGRNHLKNTFLMMDHGNSPKKYEELTNKIKEGGVITVDNGTISITQDTGTITIKYDNNGKLITDWQEKAPSPST